MAHMDAFWARDRAWTAPVKLRHASSDAGLFAPPPPYPLAVPGMSNQPAGNIASPAGSSTSPSGSSTSPAGSHPSYQESYLNPNSGQPSPGSSYPSPGGSYLSPGGSYLSPSSSLPSPGGSYLSPTGSLPSPGGSYLSPGGSYLSPGGSSPSPGSSYLHATGSYLSPGSSYLNQSGSYFGPPGSYFNPSGSYLNPGVSYLSPVESYSSSGYLGPVKFKVGGSSNETSLASSVEGSYYLSPVGSYNSYAADQQVSQHAHQYGLTAATQYYEHQAASLSPTEVKPASVNADQATLVTIVPDVVDEKSEPKQAHEKSTSKDDKNVAKSSKYAHLEQWLTDQDTAELATMDGKSIIGRLLRHMKMTRKHSNDKKARQGQPKSKEKKEDKVAKVAESGISERHKVIRSSNRSKDGKKGKKWSLKSSKKAAKQTEEVSDNAEDHKVEGDPLENKVCETESLESQTESVKTKEVSCKPDVVDVCNELASNIARDRGEVFEGAGSEEEVENSKIGKVLPALDIAKASTEPSENVNSKDDENSETKVEISKTGESLPDPDIAGESNESQEISGNSDSVNYKNNCCGQSKDIVENLNDSMVGENGSKSVDQTPSNNSATATTEGDEGANSIDCDKHCKPLRRRNSIYPKPKGRFAFKSDDTSTTIYYDQNTPNSIGSQDDNSTEKPDTDDGTNLRTLSESNYLSLIEGCNTSLISKGESVECIEGELLTLESMSKSVDEAKEGQNSDTEKGVFKQEVSVGPSDGNCLDDELNKNGVDKSSPVVANPLSVAYSEGKENEDIHHDNTVTEPNNNAKDSSNIECEAGTHITVNDNLSKDFDEEEKDGGKILKTEHNQENSHCGGGESIQDGTREDSNDNEREEARIRRSSFERIYMNYVFTTEKDSVLLDDTTTLGTIVASVCSESESSNDWSLEVFQAETIGSCNNVEANIQQNTDEKCKSESENIPNGSSSDFCKDKNPKNHTESETGPRDNFEVQEIILEDDPLVYIRALFAYETEGLLGYGELKKNVEKGLHQGEVSMVTSTDGAMDGQGIPSQYSPQTYYYAEQEPHHYRDPPPYPGHYKHLYQAGYRQSYSGSEASTDLSSTSTENLSISTRQDPQGEETIQVAPSPGPLDSPTYKDFPILSQLASLPVEIRTSNSNTFYMTGSRGASGSPELQSQSTSPVNFTSQNNSTNTASNQHAMYSTSPMHFQQPQQLTPEMLTNLRMACHSPQPQGVPRPEIPRPATAPPIPVPTSVALVTQSNYPPPPSYPHSPTPSNGTTPESLRRSYELLDRLTTHTRSQPDLTRPVNTTINHSAAAENSRRSPQVGLIPATNSNNSIQQQTSPNTQHKQTVNQDKKKIELDHAAIATRATQMVERLSDENRSLRQELDNYLKKVSMLQKFELEIQKVNDDYENLVKHSQKRENLEKMLRFRLEAELKKQRDANIKLRAQLNNQSKDVKDPNVRDDTQKEKHGQDSLLTKLLNQNKELMANNDRMDIEISAQRATLKEQRNHIDILDTALVNAQANIIHLQEQLRNKILCEERLEELEDVIADVRKTSDKRQVIEHKLRQHLEDQVKRLRTEQNGSSLSSLNRLADTDEGISSDSESTSTVQTLVSQIHDKEKQILQLQTECLKWEQKYLEEQALRQMAVEVASTPKDARIAALEQSSVETERLIAEARTERLQHLDEVYQANKKTAELEARVKSLQAQLAERDAMINVLQRHSSLSRCSSISSLLGSPLHSPNPSLLMPSTPSTSPHPPGASPRLSPTTITSISSPPSGAPSRQNSNNEMNTLLGRDNVPAHTKSNSTGSSSMTNSVCGASKETRDIQKKLAAQAALFHRLQSGDEEVQGLWQV